MSKSLYLFTWKMLKVDWKNQLVSTICFIVIMFVLSSTLLMQHSIIRDIRQLDRNGPDLLIQNIQVGKVAPISPKWMEKIISIDGIKKIIPRRFAPYFFYPAKKYFTVISFSSVSELGDRSLDKFLDGVDWEKSERGIYIGQGVKEILDKFYYRSKFKFFTDKQNSIELPILGTFSASALNSTDVILVPDELWQQIFLSQDYTDIALFITHTTEQTIIAQKIKSLIPTSRIVDLHEINRMTIRHYMQFGGVFLAIYLLPLMAFLFLLLSKILIQSRAFQKQIGILRAVGWPVSLIVWWQFLTSFFISSLAFMIAILLSYFYIEVFNGAGLNMLFLGYGNLSIYYHFHASPSITILSILAMFSIVPYVFTAILPAYKLSFSSASKVEL